MDVPWLRSQTFTKKTMMPEMAQSVGCARALVQSPAHGPRPGTVFHLSVTKVSSDLCIQFLLIVGLNLAVGQSCRGTATPSQNSQLLQWDN